MFCQKKNQDCRKMKQNECKNNGKISYSFQNEKSPDFVSIGASHSDQNKTRSIFMSDGNSLLLSEQNEIYIYALRDQPTPIRTKRAFLEVGNCYSKLQLAFDKLGKSLLCRVAGHITPSF